MEIIDELKFKSIIYSKEKSISNYKIEFDKFTNIDLDEIRSNFVFENIIFSGKRFSFYKNKEKYPNYITFKNCTFLTDLFIGDCNFQSLYFVSNQFECEYVTIRNCNILEVNFSGENVFKKGNLKIDLSEIKSLGFENIIFNEFSKIHLLNSNFSENVSIVRCSLNQILFSHCYFKSHFDYFGNTLNHIYNSAFFNKCEFNYSSFFESKFNNDTHFADCKFLNVTKLENTGDEIKTTLRFDDCEFLNQVSFNKSRIHKISFNNIKFNDIVSLQETYFDIVDIDRTIFEKQVNFDDIQIKQIYNCKRRTIRTIKLQLQKAENKIDYNKFRVYEFNAYRKDIRKKLAEFKKDKNRFHHRKREPIQLKRDLFILNISDIASEYGTDWKRAIKFTLLSGFAAFTLFFILENFKLNIDLNDWQDFVYGYFRFFLITDFKNEYYEAGERVLKFNSIISLFPFIIGKIAIAFGIYEMIQSFRKFKA